MRPSILPMSVRSKTVVSLLGVLDRPQYRQGAPHEAMRPTPVGVGAHCVGDQWLSRVLLREPDFAKPRAIM